MLEYLNNDSIGVVFLYVIAILLQSLRTVSRHSFLPTKTRKTHIKNLTEMQIGGVKAGLFGRLFVYQFFILIVISSLLSLTLEAREAVGLVKRCEQVAPEIEGPQREGFALFLMGSELLRQEGPCLSQALRQNSSARAASTLGMAVARKASSCSTGRVR
jgi:hypothetical protein